MQKKYTTVNVYTDFEDLLKKLNYKCYKPKIGSVGRALIKASKNHRSNGWLKKQLDIYFTALKHNKRIKNNNGK